MATIPYLSHLRADGQALADAARGALDRRVPPCPDWMVADLVAHTGVVFAHKARIVRSRSLEPSESRDLRPDGLTGDTLLAWYDAAFGDLLEALETTDPDLDLWTWDGTNKASFWPRRMALEAAIHRWDAEVSVGAPRPIDAELAADGVDEMLLVFFPKERDRPDLEPEELYAGPRGIIQLAETDGGRSWSVDLRSDLPAATRGAPATADAAVRASAADLFLFVWRRVGLDAVETSGDEALLAAFYDWLGVIGQ
ncbi:MAG: maleylpyruvate isomerase family mycothiol-dependent enzyme [Mycobacteriales bacterium]